MKKEYTHDKKKIFILSEDGDDFDFYKRIMKFIRESIRPEDIKEEQVFFDGANSKFIKDNLSLEIEYSNWSGTELKVDENTSEEELNRIKEWCTQFLS